MLISRDVSSWLYILIAGSFIFTLLLISRGLDKYGKPNHLSQPSMLVDSQLFSLDEASWMRESIESEKTRIKQVLADFEFEDGRSLEEHQLINGGQPVRALVTTTWRSGSTFLGDIMLSHPATYYHYEPLLHFDIRQARSGYLAQEGVRTLKDLMNCNYTNLDNYLKYGKTHLHLFSHNSRLWKYCTSQGKEYHQSTCWSPAFLNRFCPLFPFQSIKAVRLRLGLTRELVEDASLNVRVLLLVRDPRGTMESRKHRDWCPGNPDCEDPKKLCEDLESDYYAYKALLQTYPDRYRMVRYEDFSMDPYNNTVNVFRYFRFSMHKRVEQFLNSHTTTNIGGVSSTFRDSKTAPFMWKERLTREEVYNIQDSCSQAMNLWGYNLLTDEDDLRDLEPVKNLGDFSLDILKNPPK
ncbi:carbohydrate sulfotransferase 5 isoform X2 [Eurytemora carolleeae]|uniref:carbohydrate sulfotransferase 5 isoform X2 n=1 Tax=Eurytemora carolleeae TaxID=1294199 RepID=UPI000C76D46D|nr:carbohydrate sulfotransferase 5 isoform X2 [Eurytemora carolleeae]|eukprot:XP_023348675.1 carbohydrate sulfotransferase 5-like isoform X2 [Eurytemora affinis]